jgi:hypothetical protein
LNPIQAKNPRKKKRGKMAGYILKAPSKSPCKREQNLFENHNPNTLFEQRFV